MERKTVTDIIERLRRYKGPWLVPAGAADEIERLRGEVHRLSRERDDWHGRAAEICDEAADESVRLRAERDAAVALLREAVRVIDRWGDKHRRRVKSAKYDVHKDFHGKKAQEAESLLTRIAALDAAREVKP